jgi:hypothetical protein
MLEDRTILENPQKNAELICCGDKSEWIHILVRPGDPKVLIENSKEEEQMNFRLYFHTKNSN